MSILSEIPRTTKYSFRKGDRHIGVWALQRFFNGIGYPQQPEDGSFGPLTEAQVKRYQHDTGAKIDGIVGPQTQARIVRSCIVRAPHGSLMPKGLVEGQIRAESGDFIAAVNWSVPGGVDVSLTQRRVYGPPFVEKEVAAGFDPLANVARAVEDLHNRYAVYSSRLGRGEYAWRVAALAHNWPAAAEQLSRGQQISNTKQCTWAGGARFDDGARVVTWRDWAEFYAIGSKAHNHPGMVTRLAFGVPLR